MSRRPSVSCANRPTSYRNQRLSGRSRAGKPMPTPLGISFVLDTNGQMRVHSFCEVLPGVPGPAQYSVSQGPTRKLHACDLLLQVIKPKYIPALARICTHTHSHQQVGNTVVAGLSATQQTVLVQALVGPVTLRISPTFAPPPPVVNVVGPTTPAAVVTIPLPPQPQTAPERETAVSLSCICSFLAFTGAWLVLTNTYNNVGWCGVPAKGANSQVST